MSADPEYEVDTLLVDGHETSLSEDGNFTFSDLSSDHSISMTFNEVSGPLSHLLILLISVIAFFAIFLQLLIRRRKDEESED